MSVQARSFTGDPAIDADLGALLELAGKLPALIDALPRAVGCAAGQASMNLAQAQAKAEDLQECRRALADARRQVGELSSQLDNERQRANDALMALGELRRQYHLDD